MSSYNTHNVEVGAVTGPTEEIPTAGHLVAVLKAPAGATIRLNSTTSNPIPVQEGDAIGIPFDRLFADRVEGATEELVLFTSPDAVDFQHPNSSTPKPVQLRVRRNAESVDLAGDDSNRAFVSSVGAVVPVDGGDYVNAGELGIDLGFGMAAEYKSAGLLVWGDAPHDFHVQVGWRSTGGNLVYGESVPSDGGAAVGFTVNLIGWRPYVRIGNDDAAPHQYEVEMRFFTT